ncbi:MoaD/ThiS family protein [Vibrio sp. MEBiC08052]|uniref:MoaD/ThiS family protein n=1 Tax=Vibrio sp. MEBiC08052 TaxID=1761910 RepID=UPI00074100C1|nr:MoaD/ThiS family protein [Vibrio sp. MEBiC08052]
MSNINVEITIPKSLGKSSQLVLDKPEPILEIIKKNLEKIVLDRILAKDGTFNRYVLVYLNGKRVKDGMTLLNEQKSEIDIIIPMAGG